MNRRSKFSLALAAVLVPSALLAVLSPATALANGSMIESNYHQGHEHHPSHYRHGVSINSVLTVNGGSYVTTSAPVVRGAIFVYDLYAKDRSGNTQRIGSYFVTEYPGSVDWGGLPEAQQSLAAQGVQTFTSHRFWRTTGG
jgi:hypothetical protein